MICLPEEESHAGDWSHPKTVADIWKIESFAHGRSVIKILEDWSIIFMTAIEDHVLGIPKANSEKILNNFID